MSRNNYTESYTSGIEVFDVSVNSRAAFVKDASKVFREDVDEVPTVLAKDYEYMPWGADNLMPYDILEMIEADETLSTCQQFNAEICYAGGMEFGLAEADEESKLNVGTFTDKNNIPSYFMGVCQDLKHFGFAVTVIYLDGNNKVSRILRKEAMYCRFAPMSGGHIPYLLYANWRLAISSIEKVEKIEVLNENWPLEDLRVTLGMEIGDDLKKRVRSKARKFAIITRIPTVDSTYYPIPPYAGLFKGNWYNIKRLIGVAKEAKLRNTAPIKYLVQISDKYFERICRAKGVTDLKKKAEVVNEQKKQIIDYLTGAENSGKALFSNFYVTPDGKEQTEVKIDKIDSSSEGGDWATDIVEAINMICFAMRVHSNLVGSVPSKAGNNNSGSDKRELYTIAQALQKPYHDLLVPIVKLIAGMNGWKGVKAHFPFIQLTTLDENKDAKSVNIDNNNGEEDEDANK